MIRKEKTQASRIIIFVSISLCACNTTPHRIGKDLPSIMYADITRERCGRWLDFRKTEYSRKELFAFDDPPPVDVIRKYPHLYKPLYSQIEQYDPKSEFCIDEYDPKYLTDRKPKNEGNFDSIDLAGPKAFVYASMAKFNTLALGTDRLTSLRLLLAARIANPAFAMDGKMNYSTPVRLLQRYSNAASEEHLLYAEYWPIVDSIDLVFDQTLSKAGSRAIDSIVHHFNGGVFTIKWMPQQIPAEDDDAVSIFYAYSGVSEAVINNVYHFNYGFAGFPYRCGGYGGGLASVLPGIQEIFNQTPELRVVLEGITEQHQSLVWGRNSFWWYSDEFQPQKSLNCVF